jgi:PAS domain S-box-containing protein
MHNKDGHMLSNSDNLRKYFLLVSISTGIIISASGFISLSSWLLNISWLDTNASVYGYIKPGLAFCFIFGGISICLLWRRNRNAVRIIRIFSVIITLTGLLTILEYLSGIENGIDRLFIFSPAGASNFRMALISAINISLSGIILFFSVSKWRKYKYLIYSFVVFIITTSLIGLLGYTTGISDIFDSVLFEGVGFYALVDFILIAAGISTFILVTEEFVITLEQWLLTGFVFLGIVIIFVSVNSGERIKMLRKSELNLTKTLIIKHNLNQVMSRVLEIQTGVRGYLLSSEVKYLQPVFRAMDGLNSKINIIDTLVYDNPEQKRMAEKLRKLLEKRVSYSYNLIDLQNKDRQAAVEQFRTKEGEVLVDSIQTVVAIMDLTEDKLLRIRSEGDLSQAVKIRTIIYVNIFIQLFLLGIIFWMVVRNLQIRKGMVDNANRLNENLENKVRVRTLSLERSEERFRSTLENMIEGCQIVDHNFRYLFVNEAAARQAGVSRNKLQGRIMTTVFPGIEATEMFRTLRKCMSERIHKEMENHFFTSKGQSSWFYLRMIPVPEGVFIMSEDISDMKKAEEQKYASELRFRSTLDNMMEGCQIIDHNWRYQYINDEAQKHNRRPKEEMLGNRYMDMWPGIEKTELFAVIKNCLENLIPSHLETEYFFADGSSSWFEFSSQPVKEGVLIFSVDITDKKRSEKKMERLVNRLDLATSSSGIGIWDWDIKHDVLVWDQQMYKLYGQTYEISAKAYEIWLSAIHPDDREWSDEFSRKALRGEIEYNTEFRVIWPDGSIHWLKANGQVFWNEDGQPGRMLGINYDFTDRVKTEEELKQSERMYKYLFEHNPLPMWIYDLETLDFVEVNEAAVQKYGYSRDEFLQMTIKDIRPEEDHERLLANIAETTDTIASSGPWRHRNKKGEIIDVEIVSHAINYRDKMARMVLVNDITQKKIAEEELKELNESLEHMISERTSQLAAANRAKSDFLANMSHEIRTPMNAILGYSELLSGLVKNNTEKTYVTSIKSSGKTLLTLINDILDLSKIEAGRLELEYDFVNTESFFSDFQKIFEFKISEKNIRFVTSISKNTPGYIYIDGVRLRQVMLNLLSNAVKFTEEGEILLEVSVENFRHHDKGEQMETMVDLIIKVKDSGIGIDKEYQKEIFGSFYQVKGKMSRGGTGLGLAITQRLVQMMKGTIDIDSMPGEGSTFTVTVRDIVSIDHTNSETEPVNIDPDTIIFEKAVLLIVDDIYENRRLIVDALRNTEFILLEAESGFTALEILDKLVPDLIISDIRMPGMDGFEFLDKVKNNERLKNIPVMAYSASVMKEQREKVQASQFVGLLIKPLQISDLYRELMNFIPYRIISSPSVYIEDKEQFSISEVTNPGELFDSLNGYFSEKWEHFKIRQPIGDIIDFGRELKELGLKHTCKPVIKYGEEIENAAHSFNIEAILKMLKKFPDLISILQDPERSYSSLIK